MSIIMLNNICLTYGERALFDDITAHFEDGQKVGVVGRNGAGKSTLLKVISGELKAEEGSVTLSKQKRIAFLPQEVVLNSDKSVYDEVFTVFDEFLELEREQHAIEEKLAAHASDATKLMERYLVIIEALTHFDRGSAEGKAKNILQGLGFMLDKFDTPVNTLSVGWKMRVVLAKLLLQEADFYLFDEPTNHLDMVTKEWFLHFLRNSPFGYLLVTHDRYFLDRACDYIFALSLGKGTMYRGNYTRYIAQFTDQQEKLRAAHEQQKKEIERKEDTINRFRATASKAKMAQSMMKQLAKVERIQVDPIEPTFSATFPPTERTGKTVLTVKNLSYDYGNKLLFQHASCEVQRGKKVALVAMNGMGKSTLFDLIAGRLPLQTGSVEFGHNVTFALFEQDQAKALDANKTVFEEVEAACPQVPTQKIYAFLGSFLFSGDDVKKRISMLSGGERNRVAMVKVLLQNANFLLLDEPTNHLDLQAKSVLLQALQRYDGTILFVSHDHQFVQELASDIVELAPKGLFYYPGTYEEYLAMKNEAEGRASGNAQVVEKKKNTELTKEEKKVIREHERKIHNLERKIVKETANLADQSGDEDESQKTIAKIAQAQAELDEVTAAWAKLV